MFIFGRFWVALPVRAGMWAVMMAKQARRFFEGVFKVREEKGFVVEITSSFIFLRQTTGWKEPIMIREKGFLVLCMGR